MFLHSPNPNPSKIIKEDIDTLSHKCGVNAVLPSDSGSVSSVDLEICKLRQDLAV